MLMRQHVKLSFGGLNPIACSRASIYSMQIFECNVKFVTNVYNTTLHARYWIVVMDGEIVRLV